MKEITLSCRELEKLYSLFSKLNESSEYGTVTLKQENDNNGIGYTLTATLIVTHQEVEGNFTVVITDESDW
jgi:hypothetical protein